MRLGVAEKTVVCDHCGTAFKSAFRKAMFCSRACKDEARKASNKQAREQAKPFRDCLHCGTLMPRIMRADAKFCSSACNSRAHHLKRGNGRIGIGRRREIERAYIIQRDRGICHLCGKLCRPNEITLDHLIPLADGGTHSSDNLSVACLSCNTRKGARAANDQLLLVG